MDNILNKEQQHLNLTVNPLRLKKKQIEQELVEVQKRLDELLIQLSHASDHDERSEIRGEMNGMLKSQMIEYKRNVLLKRFDHQINNPYFAKITFAGENFYIGKFANISTDPKYNIIDWRAPIASLYYNYTKPTADASYTIETDRGVTTNTGNFSERINFDIEKSKILAIYDNSLRVDLLKLRIKEKSGGKLTDIIETIQKTQNQIIRAKPNRVCIVQGTAGSGKTTIAIHRLSYILYTHQDIKEKNTLLFSSSNVLINYVASTLPELDVMQVDTFTLEKYLQEILLYNNVKLAFDKLENKDENSNTLNTWNFLNFLNNYVNKRKAEILQDLQEQTFYNDLGLYTYFTRTINKPIFENINNIYSNVKYRHFSLQQELKRGNFTVQDKLYDHEDALEYFKILYKNFNPINEYKNLLTEYSLENNIKITYNKNNVDHLSAIFLLTMFLYGLNLKNKLYKQIIIDEAQDLGILNYFAVKQITLTNGFTILGDLNQATWGIGTITAWQDLNEIFGEDNIDFFDIKVSYRTTEQVIKLATKVLSNFPQIKHLPKAFERQGEEPKFKKFESRQKIIEQIIKEIKAKRKAGDIRAVGIIEPSEKDFEKTKEQLTNSFKDLKWVKDTFEDFNETGVYLIKERLVKGLEFDTVYVIDPSEKFIPYTVTGAKRMFVMVSRAINNLNIFYVEGNRLLS